MVYWSCPSIYTLRRSLSYRVLKEGGYCRFNVQRFNNDRVCQSPLQTVSGEIIHISSPKLVFYLTYTLLVLLEYVVCEYSNPQPETDIYDSYRIANLLSRTPRISRCEPDVHIRNTVEVGRPSWHHPHKLSHHDHEILSYWTTAGQHVKTLK